MQTNGCCAFPSSRGRTRWDTAPVTPRVTATLRWLVTPVVTAPVTLLLQAKVTASGMKSRARQATEYWVGDRDEQGDSGSSEGALEEAGTGEMGRKQAGLGKTGIRIIVIIVRGRKCQFGAKNSLVLV